MLKKLYLGYLSTVLFPRYNSKQVPSDDVYSLFPNW